MQGSTVLVSLVDPEGLNLWVCSLGDCQAGEFQRAVFCAAASFVFRIVPGPQEFFRRVDVDSAELKPQTVITMKR